MSKEIREMVVFAPQNLIMDPPFTKLDLLICRNLLIYLAPELQKKLLPLFHYSLNPGGILLLGSAETVGAAYRPLCPAGTARRGSYRRLDAALRAEPVEFPSAFAASAVTDGRVPTQDAAEPAPNLQTLADQLAPAALFPGGRADQRQGRHPLYQRADGQIPGAGRRQGQLEHLCHGPRGAALRAERSLPQGRPAEEPQSPCRR